MNTPGFCNTQECVYIKAEGANESESTYIQIKYRNLNISRSPQKKKKQNVLHKNVPQSFSFQFYVKRGLDEVHAFTRLFIHTRIESYLFHIH